MHLYGKLVLFKPHYIEMLFFIIMHARILSTIWDTNNTIQENVSDVCLTHTKKNNSLENNDSIYTYGWKKTIYI